MYTSSRPAISGGEMSDETQCGNGEAHTGINSVCSTCHQPRCLSQFDGKFCTKSLFHEDETHRNVFSDQGWDDPDYIPVKMTEDEIAAAIEWQKETDKEIKELTRDYERTSLEMYPEPPKYDL
jgi:hypothetical protein